LHSQKVSNTTVCGGQPFTASFENTDAVWDGDSRKQLVTLRGHTKFVIAVDMYDRLVATASLDATLRNYNTAGDYSHFVVLDWLHTGWAIPKH
jgi:WD40 repeat protein